VALCGAGETERPSHLAEVTIMSRDNVSETCKVISTS
jgi:hypothetical protein